ncbi:FAD-dependent monooxygenase [Mycolicibacterium neoaurum]|uniref:FAD-dependent monooxygenase n=1 Tax=Mycolicibacterium neoaurum TaxID=1795 RepID=UPI00248ABD3D|nr:FAD-dependent monooxygenase [Mycolicibacterium neoaurum]WBP93731.1 FAD-dependent monooxygenase [Mycolicibacterium neoaurum]WBS07492.1 FAD-dependent monooxygenase [Mycolicibacterium neoaurum]
MTTPRILIAGASIAGPATAFWLTRAGFEVTIVEQSPELRRGGNGVDIRSEALTVIDRMGLTADVRDRAMVNRGMRFVDRSDRQRVRFPTAEVENMVGSEDIEITRGDLAHLLYAATESDVEYIFGDTVTELNQDDAGVDVTFARTPGRRFDAVIGADGIHSKIRRAAFGSEDDFRVFKQHYYAVASVDSSVGEPFWTTFYNEPGRSVALYRNGTGPGLMTFTFHSRTPLSYDYRDIDAQRRLIRAAFADSGWHIPALLDAADAADDFYFDALDQISMPSWSAGRTALVGDAAYCASPASGAGALLALTGAYRLAGELSRHDSPQDAFRRFENAQRPLVAAKQSHLFTYITIPRSRLGIVARNILLSSPIPRMLGRRSSHGASTLADYYSRPIG